MATKTDSFYIDRVLSGHTDAFSILVERYKNMVFTIGLRVTENREDAEEVSQDAFVKAYKSLGKFQGKSKFSSWLYRIAYNEAISKVRKKTLETTEVDEIVINHYTEEETKNEFLNLDNEEQKKLIHKVLEEIKPQQRLLVIMFYLKGNTVEDISYITGLPKTNIKTSLHRIRKRLYEKISVLLNARIIEQSTIIKN